MRGKEGRKEQARSYKQQAKQHNTPKAVTFPEHVNVVVSVHVNVVVSVYIHVVALSNPVSLQYGLLINVLRAMVIREYGDHYWKEVW